jgi:ATP-binding cassette subfamily B protein IrtB
MSRARAGILTALWHVFGQQRWPLLAAIVLRVLGGLAMAVPVAVVAYIADHLRQHSLTQDVAEVAALTVLTAVVAQYLLWFASNYFAWVTTFHAVGRGRIAALRHVQALPVGLVAARGVGDIAAVLSADYEQVAVFAHNGLMNLVAGVSAPLVALVALAFVDPALSCVVALSMFALCPVLAWLSRSYGRHALSRADALAEAGGRIIEYVQGIATARSYDQLGPRQRWYRQAVARMREVNDQLAVRIAPLSYVGVGVLFCGAPLLIAVLAYRATGGHFDAWSAVVFLVVVLRIYAPAASAALEIEGLRLTDAALQRIGRVLELPEQAHPSQPLAEPEGHALRLDGVTFAYAPGRPVLRDVSFTAAAGTTTAIVGPSGAGKSTLLALLARFHDPECGTIALGGIPLTQLTRQQLFAALSVVFQDVYLFEGTIADNISFGSPGADAAAIAAAAAAARCAEFIERLPDGYDTRVGEGGLTLSGGERQRLSIARALLKDAPILLMDEATSALDSLNEQAVQVALQRLVRGRTVIVVAHRLATIRCADQVLVLDKGEVVQCGKHAALLAQPGLYAHLWSERERAARWRLGDASPLL